MTGRHAVEGLLGAVLLALGCAQPGFGAAQQCDTGRYALRTPAERFEDHGDGTLTDRQSRLMWMRCSIGQEWSKDRCTGTLAGQSWAAAQSAAQAINASGRYFYSDWRVPKITELATITEPQCENPRINLAVFPDTPAMPYWTATSRTDQSAANAAYALSFGTEGVQYKNKEEEHYVRLVRTGP